MVINEWLQSRTNKPSGSPVGQTLEEVLPEVAVEFTPYIREVVDTRQPIVGVEIEGPAIGSRVARCWLASFHPVFYVREDEGEDREDVPATPKQISVLVQDVTANKQAETELRKDQAYLEAILRLLPAGVAIFEGSDYQYVRINENLAQINGLTVEDHLGRPIVEILQDAASGILPVCAT